MISWMDAISVNGLWSQCCDSNKMVNNSFSESPVIDFVHTVFYMDAFMLLSVSTFFTCAILIHAIRKTDTLADGSLRRDQKRCYGDDVAFIQSSESFYELCGPLVLSFSSLVATSSTGVLVAQNETEWDTWVILLRFLLYFLFGLLFIYLFLFWRHH